MVRSRGPSGSRLTEAIFARMNEPNRNVPETTGNVPAYLLSSLNVPELPDQRE